jgi:hypothetical protein
MGYHIDHQYGGLCIAPEREADALAALADLTDERFEYIDGKLRAVPYRWVNDEPPSTFAEAMDQLGLAKEDDESGWRLDDSNGDVRWYDDEKVFELIVPFATEGDIITFVGEDDERWGYLNRGHTCVQLKARIVCHPIGDPDDIVLED